MSAYEPVKVFVVEAHDSAEGLYAIKGIYLDFGKALAKHKDLVAAQLNRMTETWTTYKVVEHVVE